MPLIVPQFRGYLPAIEQIWAAPGSYTFDLDIRHRFVDLVGIGGGSGGNGGDGGAGRAGTGGVAAAWGNLRLTRGTDIPWTATQVQVVVGVKGAGAPKEQQGRAGTATTFTIGGVVVLTCPAAARPTPQYQGRYDGQSPGDYTYPLTGTVFAGGIGGGGGARDGNGAHATGVGAGGGAGNGGIYTVAWEGGDGSGGGAWVRGSQ
ncbi:hypothetical protein MYRNA_134 [Mycobacterium phage Myrna]|uniref:Glycine-rich domain-containing protein n=1 Tax=Mycobacterium phage Myrna TaxID=546805 RepID=B5LJD8_9CAUD|nr:minor tail protein [Mycobacterium phage Myrna]ACH62135.1 hypothetical protein MYRNA_134 [Mycobacterium phage Myrna]